MTLEEAIKHAEEVADEKKKDACNLYDAKSYEESRECIWCAEEHRQLAEWLKDYKRLLEPKTGHWINVNEGKWNTIPAYKCSVCGANADLRDWSGESPFCPWCGAKMVEPQERKNHDGI